MSWHQDDLDIVSGATPRVGVTGGREYNDEKTVRKVLTLLRRDAILVHGAAPGADQLAAKIWIELGGTTEAHTADWEQYGNAAGPIRNQQMIDSWLDLLIAFPGGKGTADMMRRAKADKIRVVLVEGNENDRE